MEYNEFIKIVKELSDDVYTSEDFQTDYTGGFPTSLCVNWNKGKAWLELNETIDTTGIDVSVYQQMCADFGIRDCVTIRDFNQLLSILGDDAEETAYLDPQVFIIE